MDKINSAPLRDYALEEAARIRFIQAAVEGAGARGVVFANSGGKDCALAGILCKKAVADTVSIAMPCGPARSYGADLQDARELAARFGIESRAVDLGAACAALLGGLGPGISEAAARNVAPRLRMASLYAVAQSENRLVAGTSNRSEIFLGYFTKWGDGASDFNPIADLTVTEVYEFLEHLGAPRSVMDKPPSAGLYPDQTDEGDLGFSYAELDRYLLTGEAGRDMLELFSRLHGATAHKRRLPAAYGG